MTNNDHNWDVYQLFQLFHTAARNSIILTTLALTLLGYSISTKKYTHAILFVALSLLFICCSIITNSFLLYDQITIGNSMTQRGTNETPYLNIIQKWYIIPAFLLLANISIGTFGLVTLFRIL
jgi:hypothetical protein